jgi:hypothetical protein
MRGFSVYGLGMQLGPNPEIRNSEFPKSESNPKDEIRMTRPTQKLNSDFDIGI